MRKTTLLPFLLILALFSACKSKSDSSPQKDKTDIPEPLAESKSDILSFKRSSGNLVDAIYFNMVKQTPDLQDLENQLERFEASKVDSLQAFNTYKEKVESYYVSANQNLDNIKDTVLKSRLKLLLAAGKNKYSLKTNEFKAVNADIDNRYLVMRDYYETLKIVATLPVMEKYQDNNMPDIKTVKAVADQVEMLKVKTIKMAKKYGGTN